MNKPDDLDKINAFTAGFRHGQDCGIVGPKEAEEAMTILHMPIITADTIACFCHGSEDGSKEDAYRYILCKAARG